MDFFNGKPCQSICWESINNFFLLFHVQFVLTCSSFLSSFSPTVFIKFFLTQKSKSSVNLDLKEVKKEDKATIDQSTTMSDSSEKNILGAIHP